MSLFLDSQKAAHAAARAAVAGPIFYMARRPYRGFDMDAADEFLSAVAEAEGLNVNHPRVDAARRWLRIVCAVAVETEVRS